MHLDILAKFQDIQEYLKGEQKSAMHGHLVRLQATVYLLILMLPDPYLQQTKIVL